MKFLPKRLNGVFRLNNSSLANHAIDASRYILWQQTPWWERRCFVNVTSFFLLCRDWPAVGCNGRWLKQRKTFASFVWWNSDLVCTLLRLWWRSSPPKKKLDYARDRVRVRNTVSYRDRLRVKQLGGEIIHQRLLKLERDYTQGRPCV